jgi:hypothetical protein
MKAGNAIEHYPSFLCGEIAGLNHNMRGKAHAFRRPVTYLLYAIASETM